MFKKNSLLRAVITASLASSLVACGGGSSGSGDAGSDNSSAGATDTSVRAIDGYLAKANIYIDANQNGILDGAEKDSKVGATDSDGFVQISSENFKKWLLVEAVAGQTVDSDSGAVSETFVLTAPQGSRYITPFTHLARSTGKSYADLSSELRIPESVISGDYIEAQGDSNSEQAKSAEIAHALARFIVKETKKKTNMDMISSNLIAAKDEVVKQIKDGKEASFIEIELAESGTVIVTAPSKTAFEKAELDNTTWAMFRFDDAGDNEQMFLQLGTPNEPAGMCIVNEAFSFLNGDPSIFPPDKGTCSDGTFEVTDKGTLKLTEGEQVTEFTVLYRNKESMGDVEIQTFVLVSEVGELFWLDNNLTLEDAGDYVIGENNTRYIFVDDDGDSDKIEYYRGERQFTVTGDDTFTVNSEDTDLNRGEILFGDIGSARFNTTFDSIPAYKDLRISAGDDDILVVRENASKKNALHYHFIYRKSGDLELILDYRKKGDSENLYLQSGNKALIESLADEVEARNTGVQGDA